MKKLNLLKMETLKFLKPYWMAFFLIIFNLSAVAQNASSETDFEPTKVTSVESVNMVEKYRRAYPLK